MNLDNPDPNLLLELVTAEGLFCRRCGVGMTITLRAPSAARVSFEAFRREHEGHEPVEPTAPAHLFTVTRSDGGLSCERCFMPESFRGPCVPANRLPCGHLTRAACGPQCA
jgi:hypothetical protein